MTETVAKIRIESTIREMWSAMLKLQADAGEWTLVGVRNATKIAPSTIESYAKRLELAGIIEIVRRDPGFTRRRVFRIARTGRDAPRVTNDGAPLPETVIEILWRSMKMMRQGITTTQLAEAVAALGREANREHIGNVVRRFAEVGILAQTSPKRGNQPAAYRLVRSLGALPPQILKAEIVFDPNSGQTLGVADARDAS